MIEHLTLLQFKNSNRVYHQSSSNAPATQPVRKRTKNVNVTLNKQESSTALMSDRDKKKQKKKNVQIIKRTTALTTRPQLEQQHK